MDFVLTLHSHLPYVLNHGRWPHGTDWLTEAAVDTYLPLLETLRSLEADRVAAPVTIGFTPVLANQLASPTFADELETFLAQRLAACDEAPASLTGTGDAHLLPLVGFWRERLARLQALFRAVNGDLISAFRALEDAGRLEIIGSAATHGFLPLLARDESIRFQLGLGVAEHRRLFGREPQGCWLPECAYRPRGAWDPWPGAPRAPLRRGIEEHLADAGFRYFFVDSHLPAAGAPLGVYGSLLTGPAAAAEPTSGPPPRRSPYRAYGVLSAGRARVAAYVRDPARLHAGLEPPRGLSGRRRGISSSTRCAGPAASSSGASPAAAWTSAPRSRYDPAAAEERSRVHAEHFAGLLGRISAAETRNPDGVIVAPFDTELFGHWWFEGPDFLGDAYRALAAHGRSGPPPAPRHLAAYPPRTGIRMPAGSWGANGDFSMWLSDADRVDLAAPLAAGGSVLGRGAGGARRSGGAPVLAQAARELLLAQSSDWQFIISTGAVADYAERRFTEHCDDAERARRRTGRRLRGEPEPPATPRGRAGRARRISSPTCFPALRSAARAAPAPSRSADAWPRSASSSGCICISPSATSITSSSSTCDDVYRPLLDRLDGAELPAGRAARLGAAARVARARTTPPTSIGSAGWRVTGRSSCCWPASTSRCSRRSRGGTGSSRSSGCARRSSGGSGSEPRPLADGAGLGARARRRPRRGRRPLCAGG